MGKTPRIALASLFLAGFGLTGCESCGLFGANRPWKQDQVAASSTAGANNGASTSGWQNQPKGWTTGSADATVKTTTLGQPGNLDAGFGTRTTAPANGLADIHAMTSPAFGQTNATPAPGNVNSSGLNNSATAGNSNSFGQGNVTAASSSSQSYVPTPPGPQSSSFPTQSSGMNSQYQTQYPNMPSGDAVKTTPPPGN